MRRTIPPLVSLALVLGCHSQQLLQPRVDGQSLEQAYASLSTTIAQVIHERGGNPQTQNIHWVFGFSTGHFAQDPTAAEVARYLATQLIADNTKVGDRVSVYAWEMEVWNHLADQDRTVEIRARSPDDDKRLYKLLPRTPRKDTVGGHDTERAIVEIVREISDARDAVILLFTPTAASIAPQGQKVWGQNHPKYQEVLKQWERLIDPELSGASRGASLQIRYQVIKTSGESVPRTLDVVIVVPRQFVAKTISHASSQDHLSPPLPDNQTGSESPAKREDGWTISIILSVVFLSVIVLTLFLVKPWLFWKPLSVKINDTNIYTLSRGEGIILTGSSTTHIPEGWKRVLLASAPAVEFGRVFREGAGIVVKAENATMRIADIDYDQYRLKAGDQVQVEFCGETVNEPGLPSRNWRLRVRIEVSDARGEP